MNDVELVSYSQVSEHRGPRGGASDSEGFNQNKSAFTAGLLEMLLSPSVTVTESLYQHHGR